MCNSTAQPLNLLTSSRLLLASSSEVCLAPSGDCQVTWNAITRTAGRRVVVLAMQACLLVHRERLRAFMMGVWVAKRVAKQPWPV